MADLPTNLKDDILDSSVNTRRRYRMIENPDGTVEFEDMTEYSQVGDEYGAGLINEANRQVNARVEKAVIVRDLETIGAITQEGFIPDALALKDVNDSLRTVKTYVGEDGKLHFVDSEGADSVLPFSGFKRHYSASITTSTSSKFYELGFKPKFIALDTQWFYDEELNKCWYSNGINNGVPVGTWTDNNLFKFDSIEETGFYGTAKSNSTRFLFAFG